MLFIIIKVKFQFSFVYFMSCPYWTRAYSNRTVRPYVFTSVCCHYCPTHACLLDHYENTPIQIYRNSTSKNWKFSVKKLWYFLFYTSAQNIDCGYSLDPPRQGGANEYPQSMFWAEIRKNNVYPCKPLFYYINVLFWIAIWPLCGKVTVRLAFC